MLNFRGNGDVVIENIGSSDTQTDAYYGEEKIVDVNIRRLRMKVEDEPSNPKHIITVWGLGYKWEA